MRQLVLGALILLLAGCSPPSLPEIPMPTVVERFLGRDSDPIPEEAAPEVPAAATLHLLAPQATPGENVLLLDLVNQYNRSLFPDPSADPDPNTNPLTVTVTLAPRYGQALPGALLTDPPPDVVAVDSFTFSQLVAEEALRPLPPSAMRVQDVHPQVRAAFQVDGQLLCAPMEASTLALIYNKAIFDALDQPYPDPSWTWTELEAAAKALTVVDSSYYGLVISPDFSRWLPFLRQAGGRITDADGQMSLESAPGIAALSYFAALFQNAYAYPPLAFGAAWSGEAFANGRIAMTIEGNWLIPYLRDAAPDLAIGVADLPGGPPPTGTDATVAFANCYAIPAASRHPDEAAALIAHLTGPAAMTAWTDLRLTLPARTGLQADWLGRHPIMSPFLAGLDGADLWQFPADFPIVLANFQTDLQDVLAGSMLPSVLLNRADAFGSQ